MGAPLYDLLSSYESSGSDELLGRFLEYVAGQGFVLYPAQEEAILALFEEKNVIINTPTGSGKSLVASALHFASLARDRRSVYTCPIKALVNEKWMALCRELGPENVGLATGDATVNRDAPVLCCTAEILANIALREGEDAWVDDVVMDEFHSWRRCLGQDAGLLGRLMRIAVETVLRFYAARAAREGRLGAKTGAVTVVQRTSSDLRLNPHLHLVVLDGATEVPPRSPGRGPPYWNSRVLRRQAFGDEDDRQLPWVQETA